MTVRVLIADDFELVRRGISRALESHPEIEVVSQAADGREAVERARKLRPDVVVLDLRMPRYGGMEALDRCRDELPEIKVLVLTANENPGNLLTAIAAGAAGYLTKRAGVEELCEAVLTVHRGGSVVPSYLAARVLPEAAAQTGNGHFREGRSLSTRERGIVRLVSEGLTDKEIGERLFVSTRTVQYGLTEVKRKTGLHRRSEIARWAVINSLG